MDNLISSYPPPELVAEAVAARLAHQQRANSSWRLVKPPRLLHKPWSTLYFLTLANPAECRDLVVKIVHFPDQAVAEISWQSEELLLRGRREFETMSRVSHHFAAQPDRLLTAVQPVAYLPELNAIVMDFVAGKPLYNACITRRDLFTTTGQEYAERMMRAAGEWLRRFHQIPPGVVPAERSFGPANALQTLLDDVSYLQTLGVNIAASSLWPQTRRALQEITLSERVWTHGDFHLRNVLVLPDEKVLGFDTAMERVDSPYFDLGKFVADLKTRQLMILSQGLFPPPHIRRALTRAFLSGYLAGKPVLTLPLALYEGVFMVKKWIECIERVQVVFPGGTTLLGKVLRAEVIDPAFWRLIVRWMHTVTSTCIPETVQE